MCIYNKTFQNITFIIKCYNKHIKIFTKIMAKLVMLGIHHYRRKDTQ